MKEGTWCATKRSCTARVSTWKLRPPLDREVKDEEVPNLVVRKAQPSDPIKDLTLYQLMELLSGEGWQCVVAESKECVKHMADPYVHNDEHPRVKRWFLICKDNNVQDVKVAQPYLASLATAHIHCFPVPHFAKFRSIRF